MIECDPFDIVRRWPMKFYGVDDVYSESGVDLTLLRENLTKPIEVRLIKNSRALKSVLAFARECQKSALSGKDDMDKPLEVEGILKQLTSFQVRFVLIGGLAMRAHGSAHITEDADFCYERSPANIEALAQAFATLHPYLRGAPAGLPFFFDAATIQADCNFTLLTDLGEIDLLGHVSGLGEYVKVLD